MLDIIHHHTRLTEALLLPGITFRQWLTCVATALILVRKDGISLL